LTNNRKTFNDRRPNVIVVLFRSRLTAQAGDDYAAMDRELSALVRQAPGFIDVKSFRSEDGERLTVVWWQDKETLRQWRELDVHREAQATGRKRWYEYYKMEVATIDRVSTFDRQKGDPSRPA
jgi:heme-degrading monooxygenase HmoA